MRFLLISDNNRPNIFPYITLIKHMIAEGVFGLPTEHTTQKGDFMSFQEYLTKKSQNLTDQEIITDTLSSQKGLVKMYSTAITEGSSPAIRSLFRDNLTECASDQYDSFEYMQSSGLYPLECADKTKIKEAVQKFQVQKDNC